MQTEKHVETAECSSVRSSFYIEAEQTKALNQDGILQFQKPLSSNKETGEATNQKGSIENVFQGPTTSLNKETMVSTVNLTNYLPKPPQNLMQTSYGQGNRSSLDYKPLSTIATQPLKVPSSCLHGNTTNSRNPVAVLNEVMNQIFPDSSSVGQGKGTQLGQLNTSSGYNSYQPSRTSTTSTTPNTKGQRILGGISPPNTMLPENLPINLLNRDFEEPYPVKDKQFNPQHASKFISSSAPETSKLNKKPERFLSNIRHAATPCENGTTLIVATNTKPFCNGTAFTDSEETSILLMSTSPTYDLAAPEASKVDLKRGERKTTCAVINKGRPNCKALVKTPFSDAEVQPKEIFSVAYATRSKEPKTFKADTQSGRLKDACHFITAGQRRATSTLNIKGKSLYRDKISSTTERQPQTVFSVASSTRFREPEKSEADSNRGRNLENTWHVTTVREKRTTSPVSNNGKNNCKPFAATPFSGAGERINEEAGTFKDQGGSARLLGNNYALSAAEEKTATSTAANNEKYVYTAFVDTSSSNCERQPKIVLSNTSETFKADNNCSKPLQKTCHVTTAGVNKTTPSTVPSDGKILCKYSFSDSEVQPNVAFSASSVNPLRLLSPSLQKSGQDHNAPVTSGWSSVVSDATTTRGQSVGFLAGISMLAKAAGLETKAANQIACTVHSSKKQIPSSSYANSHKERDDRSKSDINQENVNVDVRDTGSLQATLLTSETFNSYPLRAGTLLSVSDLEKTHFTSSGLANGTNTTKLEGSVEVHQNSHTAGEKTPDKRCINSPDSNKDKRSIYNTKGMTNNSAPAPPNFPQQSSLSAPSRKKYHTTPWENQNFFSFASFYNDRGKPEHKPSETLDPRLVITTPRYHPYPPFRTKGQEAHLPSVWSNTCKTRRMDERRSSHEKPAIEVPLNLDVQQARKQSFEFPDKMHRHTKNMHLKPPRLLSFIPVSSQIGYASHAQLNSTSSNLLQPLQPSHNPRFSTTMNSSLKQNSSTVQTIMNRDTPTSKSPESIKRGFPPHLQSHVHGNKSNTKESWIHNCPALSSRPSSVTETSDDHQAPEHSLNSLSSQINCLHKPQLEISQLCQVYLNQLRKFKEGRPISTGDSINTERASHHNSLPQSKRVKVDGHSDFQQDGKVTIQKFSVKQQRESCNELEMLDPETLLAQHKKEKSQLLQHQKTPRLKFHHKKFTGPTQ